MCGTVAEKLSLLSGMHTMDRDFEKLVLVLGTGKINYDILKLNRAWEFTKIAHTGQVRLSGGPYCNHSLEVAIILAKWGMDESSIIAGLLHDTIEDGGANRNDIVNEFGENVALLVDGVTKVTNIRWRRETKEHFIENLRKMVLFMAKDIRVVLIKLADRLHNMRTLYAVPESKRNRIAKETLEIYAPLAERLGMGEVTGELSDLAFRYAYPKTYSNIENESRPFYKKTSEHISKMIKQIREGLKRESVEADIVGREKRLYSLWRKMERKSLGNDFDSVHDIVALRIIVENVTHCYTALGVVHSQYKPVPYLGVSDFIAQPKPNGYQSIHTKVFGPDGRIVEVQIRTKSMHEQAEYGVAAHWAYAESKAKGVSDRVLENKGVKVDDDKLIWVKQLVEWQKEIRDSKEYYEAVKIDAFNERNFVFSPKGDVYDLPQGATPIDFAYLVHTDLPEYISAAKVNGRIVPLNYSLQAGDVVEIVKSKNPHAINRDWLRFVVTTQAKRMINKQLRKDS